MFFYFDFHSINFSFESVAVDAQRLGGRNLFAEVFIEHDFEKLFFERLNEFVVDISILCFLILREVSPDQFVELGVKAIVSFY